MQAPPAYRPVPKPAVYRPQTVAAQRKPVGVPIAVPHPVVQLAQWNFGARGKGVTPPPVHRPADGSQPRALRMGPAGHGRAMQPKNATGGVRAPTVYRPVPASRAVQRMEMDDPGRTCTYCGNPTWSDGDVCYVCMQKNASSKSVLVKETKETVTEKCPWQVGSYYKQFQGAVVLIQGQYVVVLEHYQLKHQSSLGELSGPGGPFKGKKGTQMSGGWNAHVQTYGPAVLEVAQDAIQKLNGNFNDSTTITLRKVRLDVLEGYISITREGNFWIITYHCNPPG